MDLQMTQVLNEDTANGDNDDDTKVGVLCVGTTEHRIVKGVTKIGRNRALCQIVINDLTVSNVHAEIQAGCETAFISDVRSANGTKIKDVQLKPFFYYTINDGDAIYLGIVKAIFKTKKSSQHNSLILPETPIPSRRLDETNTPGVGNASDFLFNNTSVYQSDNSVIPGTQEKGKKSIIFQEPSVPADRRRVSNRISAVSGSAFEKKNKETKSQGDVDATDLHDLETQQFDAVESLECNKSKQNDKATKSQDDVEPTDVHELETQKMDHDSILGQSQSRNKQRSEKNQQYFDDTNIYDAETQILPHVLEIEESKVEKKINRSRMNDSIASSGRGNNSSSGFSRILQISSTPSPPPSPNPLDESDIPQSQNLLELCETPLLQFEKKANDSGKSSESRKPKNFDKSDATTSEENSGAKFTSNSMENTTSSKKSVSSNHVIAESDDESATDDDLDIEIAKANPGSTKLGIPACRPSDVIEDDSPTDDEGEFESLALRSPPKEKPTLSLTMCRKSTENRNVEVKISDAKTQRMDQKKYKLGGAKFLKETTEDRNSVVNIFDAETQRIDQDFDSDSGAEKSRDIATKRMDLKIHAIAGAKKRRQIAEDRETDDNIFEAATQKMAQENPAEVVVKKRRETVENRGTETTIFDAETHLIDPIISNDPGAKKRQQITQDLDVDTNIFEVATQRTAPESPTDARGNKRRELEKDRKTENIFDAETQLMDVEIGDVAGLKKRGQIADNLDGDVNIFEVATQRIDPESTATSREKKRRELPEDRETEANIYDAATQRTDEDIPDLGRSKKRCDLAKETNEDTDIDLLPTQVLNVPTSTPVSRTRKWKEVQSKKSSRLKTEEDLHSAPTPTISEWDDIVDDNSTEDSAMVSPKLGAGNKRNKRNNRATVNSTAASHSPKSKGRKKRKNPRLETKNDSDMSLEKMIGNGDDSVGKKSSKRSAGSSSSFGDENGGEEKNNRAVNLDETLMRNLGMILGQEANEQELADESTQIMTQNLVDMLRPTQSFEEAESRDSGNVKSEPSTSKRKKIQSPRTLGFRDGQAVGCSSWSDDALPKATSTMREDKKEDEEETEKTSVESKLSEWLDPDSIFYGLPEVRISGTLSNPGSPCPSTTSTHSDFVAPSLRETEKSTKPEDKVAVSSTESSSSLKSIEAAKSLELDSPVVQKKSRVSRKRIARKIIEDEDQDSDDEFGYNDLKKMADNLLASGSASSTKSEKKDNETAAQEPERFSATGRQLRHVRKAISSKNDADSCRSTRNFAKPSSSLIVSDFKGKRSADETASSTDAESSSSGVSRASKRIQKSTKSVTSRSKAVTKRGKESQEVEAILAANPKKNVVVASKRSYATVQLTRLDESDVSQQSSISDKVETPKTNRKRRATMSAKDVTPTSSPASTKSRRTISEGLENLELPKVQHKILLTGLNDEHTKLVKKLGGSVVSEPSKATVLITDKVRRTYKFLCAVARGLQVLSVNWLLESEKAGRFLDCDDFILKDPAAEKLYKFQLEKSLQAARTKKLLQGYSIIVTPKVNQPAISELKGIIEASGGKVLTRAPSVRAWNTKTVIVSREEDSTAIKVLLSKCPETVKITVQSTEFILTGILRQEVNPVEHRLNIR